MYHMDFSEKLVINTKLDQLIESTSNGVRILSLENEGIEAGHETSIIEFKAGASRPQHLHPLGEEIFVLEGTFSDENGDYPSGTYIKNSPGSVHAPFSKDGCLLFVKSNQMDPKDTEHFIINTQKTPWRAGHRGLEVLPLHNFGTEGVALVKWPKGERFLQHTHFGGEEIFVLSGEFIDEHGRYPKGTWIRSPHLSSHFPYVEEETIIFVKTGHLIK